MDATMEQAADMLVTAHELYARAGGGSAEAAAARPPIFKVIGIILAVSSGAFIGSSFVLKKHGLLAANEKYNEVAGEGYGYLKNAWWWSGMTLMIVGEICNFVAYAFTDAILVTPLGALSVVICAVLSAIFLKERLSMVGKVACFLCIVGSVVIVMNAPQDSSVANIEQMQEFVISPGFLSYTGVIILGSVATALYAGPRWGKKNMLVYISICSWIGGLSVVATQGLGAAIITQIGGKPQFNQWFIYVLLVFVISTLLTEIVYLNKALNLFNAAMVTPTYYVYFTSTTIITSAVLFRGFKGTVPSIITVVNGFLTICAGVVLLQLSKSAKDVPDSAVFAGDLDQIQTIAEQEQPETDPKADAIRGAAAIVRRFSSARQKMEAEELKRLHEEKRLETLEAVNEEGQPRFEWDGLRRRRTIYSSQRSRSGTGTSPFPPFPQTPHPPLGWSHFPTQEELDALERQGTPGGLSSIVGTIRTRARSILVSGQNQSQPHEDAGKQVQSPMHPVQLTEISFPPQNRDLESGHYHGKDGGLHISGNASKLSVPGSSHSRHARPGDERVGSRGSEASSLGPPPTPPPHGGQSARRTFSFHNVFRRHQQHASAGGATGSDGADDHHGARPPTRPGTASRGYSNPHVRQATEEERLGLVTGDSRSMPALPRYDEEADEDDDDDAAAAVRGGFYSDDKSTKYGRGITSSPPGGRISGDDDEEKADLAEYESQRSGWTDGRGGDGRGTPGGSSNRGGDGTSPPPPSGQRRHSPPRGGTGAFI